MKKKLIGTLIIILLLFIGYSSYNWFFSNESANNPELSHGEVNIENLYNTSEFNDLQVTEYHLTAKEVEWSLGQGKQVNAWTYNGTVPGESLRVTEGNVLKVNLKNELDVPVTIHWHGVILPNVMDGVPDLTQEAVQPGETFTYQFVAKHPGTYWYHSHQQSSLQVDKGLYGSLVIEDKDYKNAYDNEQILILDEWSTDGNRESITNMPGMMMGSMSGDGEADTKEMYDTYSVNGKTGDRIKPIVIKNGEKALIRVINAGYQVQKLAFPNGKANIVAFDASNTIEEKNKTKIVEVAPGERVDIELTNNQSEPWLITNLTSTEGGTASHIPILSNTQQNYESVKPSELASEKVIDGSTLGNKELIFNNTPDNVDVSYEMDLSMGMQMGEGMTFQINEQAYPNTPPIKVKEGDIVKVEIKNNGRLNHPMHLHGHRFQVVSKNGTAFENPMVKDLINVKPGETYEIYFKANNQGEWLFHCHDNNHADRGMMTIVDYEGY